MATVIDVFPPEGEKQRHVSSFQAGNVEARQRADGGIVIVGVRESQEVRGAGGDVLRPAARTEEELETYPPGTRFEYVIS